MRRRAAWFAAVVVQLLVLSGCGSTVPLPSEATGDVAFDGAADSGTAAGLDLGGQGGLSPARADTAGGNPEEVAAGGEGDIGGAPPSTTPGQGPSADDPVGDRAGTGRSRPGRRPADTAGAVGPGVSATAINIGVSYVAQGQTVNQAAGANGITSVDQRQAWKVVLDDINRAGGVLGRKLVPVFHRLDPASAETREQEEQAACDDWTQDHKVLVITDGGDVLRSCAKQRGVAIVEQDISTTGSKTFRRFPHYVEVSMLDLDRTARALVPALSAQRYFGADASVGVITYDTPDFATAVDDYLLPALKAAGHPAADVRRVHYPRAQSEAGQLSAQVASAVLRFNSMGINRVVLFDGGGPITFFFTNAADGQNYRPRYAVSSQTAAQVHVTGGNIPASQFHGAVGIGWWPTLDLRRADHPIDGPMSNSARRRCLALLAKHGHEFPDTNAEATGLAICDKARFIVAALQAGGAPNIDALVAGVNRIGGRFVAAATFGTFFGPAQHNGVSVVRHWAFQRACECFRYVGKPYRID